MTGVYCFDMFVKAVKKREILILGQFHDEIIVEILKPLIEPLKAVLLECIAEVNKELNLNVELGISMDFGRSYADIH